MADPRAAADDKFGDVVQPITSTTAGEVTKPTDDVVLDDAAKYLANSEEYPRMTPEQEKKIVKKIDAWMIPLVCYSNAPLSP